MPTSSVSPDGWNSGESGQFMTEFVMPVGLYEKALPAELCWEERLATAADAGYDFMDISVDESDERLARLDWPASERTALRRAIANSGVPIMTMCLSAHRKYPLGSHSPQLRRQGLEILRKAIEFSADLGCVSSRSWATMSSTNRATSRPRRTSWKASKRASAGRRGRGDVGPGERGQSISRIGRQGAALGARGRFPLAAPYPDMGNLAAAGYHPPDEILLAKGYMVAIHVKDSLPRVIRGVPFETGIVPLEETFQALAQIDFWGPLGWRCGRRWIRMAIRCLRHRCPKLVDRLVAAAWPPGGNGSRTAQPND